MLVFKSIRAGLVGAGLVVASMSSGHAATVDMLLTSLALGSSGDAVEIAAIETAAGLTSGSLTLEDKDSSVTFTSLSTGVFQIDLGLSTPGYFLLKFGVGRPGPDTHYLFKNLADLTKIVFTDAQVDGLMAINGNDVGGKLSHYTTAGVSAVPLPATGLLLIGALGGLAAARRRRKTA